jgi:hypothetical protein
MKENDEDVVHVGIVSKSQKIPEFRPILEFATDKPADASIPPIRPVELEFACTAGAGG